MLIPTKNRLYNFESGDTFKGEQVGAETDIDVIPKGEEDEDDRFAPRAGFCLTEFPDCCAVVLAHNFDLGSLPRGHRASILKSLPEIAKWLGYTYVLFADTVPDRGCLDKITSFRNSRTGNTVTLHGSRV